MKVCGVVMARDSREPVTLRKPPELATRSTLAVTLGMKACGDMVGCDSVPPNESSSATAQKGGGKC